MKKAVMYELGSTILFVITMVVCVYIGYGIGREEGQGLRASYDKNPHKVIFPVAKPAQTQVMTSKEL